MNIVILAGGSGTRLWPMSRKDRAKQFTAITNDKTMLEITLDRFAESYDKDQLYISTTPQNRELVEQILPDFSREHILVEPEMRDTAAAMGYVACRLAQKDPDEPLAFVPADHFIKDTEDFLRIFKVAQDKIKTTGKMVDIGIVPENPSTALGYTKIGKRLDSCDGVDIYEFMGHKEKPDYKKAQEFVRDGKYLWHANYYMWTPRLLLEALKKHAPEVHAPLQEICELIKKEAPGAEIKKAYRKIPRIMIDYALTEKMNPRDILIIKGEFGWSDIGSWDVLHEKLAAKADEKRNLVKGQWLGIETSNSLIYADKNKVVATIGVDDMVIVDTPDALLVCPKGRAQEVKKVVEEIKKKKKKQYL